MAPMMMAPMPVMLVLVASIHALNAALEPREDVDGRDKPDHDCKRRALGLRFLG
ncbi:hypothetical protein [Bosea sp. BH3]|uniref:hypothetical protein n=1 Tax=Bosea sp. BH3 TaxID=2871701 RepID=UPI0021CB77F3|nr:hypothetical protein [Bosea sp. BH3]